MTLGEIEDLYLRYFERHPPLHLIVAAALGAKGGDDSNAPAGSAGGDPRMLLTVPGFGEGPAPTDIPADIATADIAVLREYARKKTEAVKSPNRFQLR